MTWTRKHTRSSLGDTFGDFVVVALETTNRANPNERVRVRCSACGAERAAYVHNLRRSGVCGVSCRRVHDGRATLHVVRSVPVAVDAGERDQGEELEQLDEDRASELAGIASGRARLDDIPMRVGAGGELEVDELGALTYTARIYGMYERAMIAAGHDDGRRWNIHPRNTEGRLVRLPRVVPRYPRKRAAR